MGGCGTENRMEDGQEAVEAFYITAVYHYLSYKGYQLVFIKNNPVLLNKAILQACQSILLMHLRS